jgi:hypothetical protein
MSNRVTKAKENRIRGEYVLKLKTLNRKINRVPLRKEFISEGLGTAHMIKTYFGTWEKFVEVANLEFKLQPKKGMVMYDDIVKLADIMNNFGMPTNRDGQYHVNPISKLIFCNILADKYPVLREAPVNSESKSSKLRTEIRDYFGYSKNASVKYQLRENAIESIRYCDEYRTYKFIRAAFNEDVNYKNIQANRAAIMTLQSKIRKLEEKILEE